MAFTVLVSILLASFSELQSVEKQSRPRSNLLFLSPVVDQSGSNPEHVIVELPLALFHHQKQTKTSTSKHQLIIVVSCWWIGFNLPLREVVTKKTLTMSRTSSQLFVDARAAIDRHISHLAKSVSNITGCFSV